MKVKQFIQEVMGDRYYRGQIVAERVIEGRPAVYGTLDYSLPEPLQKALEKMGITKLYSHQAEAIKLIEAGKNVVVVTSTASGKTLCYNIPVVKSILEDPTTKALYIFPTKALAQDQLKGLTRLQELLPDALLRAGTYDGDTPSNTRRLLRDEGNCILTNPDMLHGAILPNHASWGRFFSKLKYVVIDEIHTYRGVFGSNVANVIRRLKRICEHYGSSPQFILASATIANPVELAERLIGAPVSPVTNDGSPKGKKVFLIWNPPLLDKTMERKSCISEAKELMVKLLRERVQTIAFTRARVVAEVLYRYVREDLARYGSGLANAVRAYRGGYLPEERRTIEKQLFSGELLGVISTNALELGIDIGSLDACLIVGFPGTIASTWQQAGRAGRSGEDALAVLLTHNTPIDQYLANHPQYFFEQTPENAIIDPENPYVVVGHLRAAAYELPIRVEEEAIFGRFAPAVLDILAEDKQIVYRGDRWFWIGKGYPADDFNLRNISENTYTIVDTTDGNKVIGSIDELSAFTQLHTEAVYMHEGDTYFVSNLDLTEKVAYVHRAEVDYYTQAISDRRVKIEEEEVAREVRDARVAFGEVEVTYITYMFKKIKFESRDSIGFGKIDLPPTALDTCAVWLTPPLSTLHRVRQFGRNPMDGLLGLANVANEVIPLFAMCDPMDIGTVVEASNIGVPTVFVFDRFPGGVGYAQKTYEMMEEILEACLELISQCQCEDGCPSCVGAPLPPYAQNDPDSETKGRIPDKEAALIILHDLLGKEPYIPRMNLIGLARQEAGATREVERPPSPPLPERVELRIRKQVQRMKK